MLNYALIVKDRNRMFEQIMPKHSICAEVGVREGDNAIQILRRSLPKRLHLIDPWDERYSPHYESIKERMTNKPVVIHRGRSTDIGRKFPDNFFDWVYVDADHSYNSVSKDLHLYYHKIKPGGVLAGHDFSRPRAPRVFTGVVRAVHEILNENLGKLICFSNEQHQRSFAMRVVK
jgi:predicted O-methyltransferase YrrM